MSYPQFQPFPQQYAQPVVPQQPAQPYAPAPQMPMQAGYAPAQPMQSGYAPAPQMQPVPMMGNPFAQPQPPQFAPMQQAAPTMGYAPAPQMPPTPAPSTGGNPFAMFAPPAHAPTPAPTSSMQGAPQPAPAALGQPFAMPVQQPQAPAQPPAVGTGGAAAAATDPAALQAQINDLRAQQQAWHVRTQLTQLAGEMGAINPEIVHRLVAEHFRANDNGQLMVAADPRMQPRDVLAAFLNANQYLLRPLVPGGGSGAATPTGGPPMQPPADPRTAQGATAVANNVMASVLGLRPQPQQTAPHPQYPQGYAPQYPAQGYAQQLVPQPFGLPSQTAPYQYPVR